MRNINANRHGYKTTKLGWIPEEWKVVSVNDISIDGTRNGLYKEQEYYGEGVEMVHMTELFARDIIINGGMPKVALTEKEIKNFSLTAGDLLFARRSLKVEGVGKCSLVSNLTGPVTFESSIIKVTPDKRILSPEFAYFVFSSTKGRSQMLKFARQVAVSGITGTDILQYRLPLPPLPEQRRIAAILSTWDEAIAKLDQLIARKQALKKGLMQQLLTGKLRFPEFVPTGGTRYKETKVGVVPEEWEVMKVSSITIFHKQGFYTQEEYSADGNFHLLRGTDMQNPKVHYENAPKINASEKDYENFKVEPGDVLIVRSGALGRYGIVYEGPNAIFGSYLIKFNFDSTKVSNAYFGLFYSSSLLERQLLWITQGSSNSNINADNIKSLLIPLPSLAEQDKIEKVLSTLAKEVENLEQEKKHLQVQKKGLMQQLLTGAVRIKEPALKESSSV